ncbi:MAG: magnesium transporter [Candidatus Cloacimonadota bacterium]|nr:MAG: magnesium transporter [Candidatus Cloacimonadota bacterium]
MKKLNYDNICELIEQKEKDKLGKIFAESHPADVAQLINDLPHEFEIYAFSVLDEEFASEVLPDLYDNVRENILDHISAERLVNIVDELDTDEAADIMGDLDDEVTEKVFKQLDDNDCRNIKKLMTFDEDTAGGLMQSECVSVNIHDSRDSLIRTIKKQTEEVDNLHYVFVKDDSGVLVGILEITDLLWAKPNKTAEELMEKDIITASVDMDQEKVAHIFRKYDLLVLPVVDEKFRLMGRITVDDIIDVIDEEASEDAFKLAGMGSEDKVFTSPVNSVKKRLPWLSLNLFTAMLVSSVVGLFENTIHEMPVLAVLMPIVAGLGGNSGTQTLTVITRGIALGELTVHNTLHAILKEVSVGLINGLSIGTITMFAAYIFKGNLMLGVVMAAAMIANMLIAGLVGSLVPVILKSMKIDPALASSVIITMLTDMGGFASFLGLAAILL